MANISQYLIDSVTCGISSDEQKIISTFHNEIRDILSDYETFLQGSYANNTEINDFNDVDIVAVYNGHKPLNNWTSIILDIKKLLYTNPKFRGKALTGNRCIKLNLPSRKADVVPAIRDKESTNYFKEPIKILRNRLNYPKTHIYNGEQKNKRTDGNYKKIVRMIKNFVNSWQLKKIAPSFYLECLIYNFNDKWFTNDLPQTFYAISNFICYNDLLKYDLITVADDKQIISQTEWQPALFNAFRSRLKAKLLLLEKALLLNVFSMTNEHSDKLFKQFFHL